MKKLLIIPFLYFSITGCSPKIQRTVKVTNNIASLSTGLCKVGLGCIGKHYISGGNSDKEKIKRRANKRSLIKECDKISIHQEDLDNALERGAKVITSQEWEGAVEFAPYWYGTSYDDQSLKKHSYKVSGACYGFSYIIEGKKSVLDKYAPKK